MPVRTRRQKRRERRRCEIEQHIETRPSRTNVKRCRTEKNVSKRVFSRNFADRRTVAMSRGMHEHRFKNFKRTAELDTFDPDAEMLKLAAMQSRSKIQELIVAEDIIFGLTQSGVCMAFDQYSKRRLCIMNTSCDEVVRSLFHAKCSRSLITVSVYREDNFSSLQCNTILLEDVRQGRPDRGWRIFQSELLRWPGFVEFDDVNSKVLTYSAKDRKYKVWSLKDYSFMYCMDEQSIEEIKISPGIMLVIFNKSDDEASIPLQIRNIETGEILKDFDHKLTPRKEIEFIEQFNEKLLVKQHDGPLLIMDVRTGGKHGEDMACLSIPGEGFKTPKAFIFLYENSLFLTFRRCEVGVWNFKGRKVTKFDDHRLYNQETNTSSIYINTHQDLIISYCQNSQHRNRNGDVRPAANMSRHHPPRAGFPAPGSINVSHILSGRCLARIVPSEDDEASTRALTGITALFYSEASNEIFTGNADGLIHVWTN